MLSPSPFPLPGTDLLLPSDHPAVVQDIAGDVPSSIWVNLGTVYQGGHDWDCQSMSFGFNQSCDFEGQQRLKRRPGVSNDRKSRPNQLSWMHFLNHKPAPPKSTNVVIPFFCLHVNVAKANRERYCERKSKASDPQLTSLGEAEAPLHSDHETT